MSIQSRELVGTIALVTRVLAIAFALFQVYTAGFGLLTNLQQRSIHVAFAIILILFLTSARKGTGKHKFIPIWDLIMVILMVVSAVYICVNQGYIIEHPAASTTVGLALGALTIVIIMECGRRSIGMIFPILAALGMLYAYLGPYIPGKWGHAGFTLDFILSSIYLSDFGMWGHITGVSASIVAIFIIFGSFLLATGGGQTFIDISLRLAGRATGGPPKVAVISSSLFGTLSGHASANVAVTGQFTIPLMKRSGYEPEFAGGTEAVASCGGQILPPIMGTGAFIMAVLLGIPYLNVCIAAIIPAFLYFVCVFLTVHVYAKRQNLPKVSEDEIVPWHKIIKWERLVPLFVPVIVLLWFLLRGTTVYYAGFAALMAMSGLFLFRNLELREIKGRFITLINALEDGARTMLSVVTLCVCANIVICMINATGIGVKLSGFIFSLGAQNYFSALCVTAATALILGMGMPTSGAYLLTAAVIGPAMVGLGISGIQAHMFIFYYACLSTLTPPVCASIFVAVALAKGQFGRTAGIALRLAAVAYVVPFAFIYDPAFLMQGPPLHILMIVATAVVGIAAIAASMFGYLLNPINIAERIWLFPAGMLILLPGWNTDLIGIGMLVFYLGYYYLFSRPRKSIQNLPG